MKVLQFAFSGGPENSFLPHRYHSNCVVYTGTYDNDISRWWCKKATEYERDFVCRYGKVDGHDIHWDLIKLAQLSVADITIISFQDVIGLEARDG